MPGRKNLAKTLNAINRALVIILVVLLAFIGITFGSNPQAFLPHPTRTPFSFRLFFPGADTQEYYLYSTLTALWTPAPSPTQTARPADPTRTKVATWTPYPTITPFVPLKYAPLMNAGMMPTSVPTPVLNGNDTYCAEYYSQITDLHQYYLDYYNSIYDDQITYYKYQEQKALANQDNAQLAQIQQEIDQVEADHTANIDAENTRYNADLSNFNTLCG